MPWILAAVGGGLVVLVVIIVLLLSSGSGNPPKVAQNVPVPFVPDVPPPAAPIGQETKTLEMPAGKTPDKIEQETIQKVKKSTAFLKVKFSNGQEATGSGFFAGEKGLVFTNAHVLGMLKSSSGLPTNVEVIVHSGEKEEFSRPGRVLGVDQECDLGVLRIDDTAGLPQPLPVDSTRSLTELQEVYVFGFPCGTSLGKNITVSKSSVSSIRKDANGIVYQVQVTWGHESRELGRPRGG